MNDNNDPKKACSINMKESTWEILNKLAGKEDRSRSNIIERLLLKQLQS